MPSVILLFAFLLYNTNPVNANLISSLYAKCNPEFYNLDSCIQAPNRTDKSKSNANSGLPKKIYVIAGSYLIPKNAQKQVSKLKNLGFSKSFVYNFPETEYYSAVVDTFKTSNETIKLTEKLRKEHIKYFIKNY